MTITWMPATDACGNTVAPPPPLVVMVEAAPEAMIEPFTAPGSLSCAAAATLTAPPVSYTNSQSGTCSIAGTFVGTVGAHPGNCGGTITISYADATDACGRTITAPADVVVLVAAASAPTLTFLPSDVVLTSCDQTTGFPPLNLNYSNGETGDCENSGTITVTTDTCLLYTSPSPRDATLSRMPSSA